MYVLKQFLSGLGQIRANWGIKSFQSTLSQLMTTSVPRAIFTHFLDEHGFHSNTILYIE